MELIENDISVKSEDFVSTLKEPENIEDRTINVVIEEFNYLEIL